MRVPGFIRNHPWWIAAAVAVIAVAAGVTLWTGGGDGPEFRLGKVERGPLVAAVAASGTLNPVVSVQVGSQVSGQIKEILVDFNSEVKQGQLIARLDPETFEYKMRQAQADLDAARAQVLVQQANIMSARAALSRSQVNATDAKRELDQKQKLLEKGFISPADRDKTLATFNALTEDAKAASAMLDVAQAQSGNVAAVVKQREAQLAQARIDLGRTEIRAPVNGIVIKRSVDPGQTVAASLQAPELFIIAQSLSDMRVDTAIDEADVGRIQLGQKATFTVDSFPGRTFNGEVTQVRKAAQNVQNVITYVVVVSTANPDLRLLPGMTANVRIITARRESVLKVPNAALRFRPPSAAPAGGDAKSAKAEGAEPGDKAAKGAGRNAFRERLEKEIAFDDTQKPQLDALFAAQREKIAALRDLPEGERAKAAERNRADLRARIAELLKPEQKPRFEELVAEFAGRAGSGRTGSGRVWIIGERGEPKAVNVRTGLSDGAMTEILGDELAEGAQIITGYAQAGAGGGPRSPSGPRLPF
ncbi:MAG: efflux RND transporter periplasmic adaptor subunit [Burkholderiales bacterium]